MPPWPWPGSGCSSVFLLSVAGLCSVANALSIVVATATWEQVQEGAQGVRGTVGSHGELDLQAGAAPARRPRASSAGAPPLRHTIQVNCNFHNLVCNPQPRIGTSSVVLWCGHRVQLTNHLIVIHLAGHCGCCWCSRRVHVGFIIFGVLENGSEVFLF